MSALGVGVGEAEIALELLKLAKRQGWLDRLIAACKIKHKILLLGATGTGKTMLMKSLSEVVPTAIYHLNRTEFVTKHHIKISKQPFILIDTPGQRHHKSRRMQAMQEAMGRGILGIMNVVSYGYHEYRRGTNNMFNNDLTVKKSYLKEHRKLEIDSVREWSSLLGDRKIASWLITVVTKADFWWDRRYEVMKHYSTGDYLKVLGDAKTLNPTVVHYSAGFYRFYGKGRLAGVFDESDRVAARGNLLRILLESIGKAQISNK